MRLSIVIPACNEEKRIGRMLDAYLPYYSKRYGDDVELIVVINGSTDGTENVVRAYSGRFPVLRCLVEPGRIGKGGALIRGFEQAEGSLVGFVDADGATPPEAFQELVDNIGNAGVIIASRWRKGANVSPRQPLERRIASRIFNYLVRLGFGLRLTDTQCGAKLMSRAALREALPRLGITQWAFDVDLLFQLKQAGCRVLEIPTTWRDVAGSKVEVIRTSFEMIAAITRLRLLYSPFRWIVAVYDRYLGPFIHPPGMEQDRLFRHSLIVLAGAQMANVFNLLFQALMVGMLGDEEYGILSAMLGTFVVLSTPMGALSQTAAHFAAVYLKEGQRGRVAGLVRRLLLHLLLAMVPVVVGVIVLRHDAAAFFRMEGTAPVLMTALALAVAVCGTPLAGALLGLQAFIWSSSAAVVLGAVRLGVAVAMVLLGWQALGALAGQALGGAACFAFSLYALRQLTGESKLEVPPLRGVYPYFLRYMLVMVGFAVLACVDVPLVKHYFAPAEAGLFAKAAMVARVVVFLPLPVAAALFPKVVSEGRTTAEHMRTLIKGTVLVVLMVGSVALVCLAVPGLLLKLFRAGRTEELVPYVRGMTLALLPLSVVSILMNFELAQRRFAVMVPLLLCAGGYVAAVVLWHPSVKMVVAFLAAGSWLAMLLCALCVAWGVMRLRPSAGGA